MTDYKGIKTFDELIEREHGKIRTDSRNEYEEKATLFIVSEMLKEARKESQMTQEQLAEKDGTKKVILPELIMPVGISSYQLKLEFLKKD